MSNVHTREFDEAERSLACVFHIPIPAAGNNLAGIQWQTVVKNWRNSNGGTVSVISEIDPTEQAQLDNGELIEVSANVVFSSINLNNAQRQTEVNAAYSAEVTRLQTELQTTLNFFGHTI